MILVATERAIWRMRLLAWGIDGMIDELMFFRMPAHMKPMLRHEYRLLRNMGATPQGARYAVSRMLDFGANVDDVELLDDDLM